MTSNSTNKINNWISNLFGSSNNDDLAESNDQNKLIEQLDNLSNYILEDITRIKANLKENEPIEDLEELSNYISEDITRIKENLKKKSIQKSAHFEAKSSQAVLIQFNLFKF